MSSADHRVVEMQANYYAPGFHIECSCGDVLDGFSRFEVWESWARHSGWRGERAEVLRIAKNLEQRYGARGFQAAQAIIRVLEGPARDCCGYDELPETATEKALRLAYGGGDE